jgi:hypothetical protein
MNTCSVDCATRLESQWNKRVTTSRHWRGLLLAAAAVVMTFAARPTSAVPPGSPVAPDGCSVWFTSFVIGGLMGGASWNDQSNDEDGFTVEWRLGGPSHASGVINVAANTTVVPIVPVASGSALRCRVRAFNANGHSSWSNWASASPSGSGGGGGPAARR